MQFNIKELIIMFIVFLVGTWIGGWINDAIGISPTGDFVTVLIYAFIPFAVFYLIWKNYGRKAQAA